MKEEIPLHINDFFRRSDIGKKHIQYNNDGTEVGNDAFMVDISDGIHHVPVKFKIKVKVS